MKLSKRKGLLLLCLFLCYLTGCRNEKQQEKLSRVSYVDSIATLVQDSLYSNVTYSRALLRNALKQAKDSLSYYELLTLYGKTFFVSSDFDSIRFYHRFVRSYMQTASPVNVVHDISSEVNNMEGNIRMQFNQPDSAVFYYKQAYESCLKGTKSSRLPDLCINLGDAYVHKGRLDSTVLYYRRALFICDSIQLPQKNKIPIYCGLGQSYMELRDFDLSNEYYEMAGKLFPEMTVFEKWLYLNNRGNHYYYKKDYQAALSYMNRAQKLVNEYPQMVYEQNLVKINLGELYVLTDKLDSARHFLNEGLAFFSEVGHQSAIYYAETQMIELALKEGNLSEARKRIAQTSINGHVDANMQNIRNQYLQHYFEQTGDYKQAYEYQKRDLGLNDSIRNERIRARVVELDLRYQQDTTLLRKEVRILQQEEEMHSLRLNVYIWILVCIGLLAGSIVIWWWMRKKRELLRERFLQQVSRVRMESLRGKVSPHFTFNVLGREINRLEGDEKVQKHLLDLVGYLRRSLELTEKLTVSLQDELDFVVSYIQLEEGRLGTDFEKIIQIDNSVDLNQTMVPSMIIQIPVENAIKHGLSGKEGEKKLQIDVCSQEKGINIQITDNGKGYMPQMMSDTKGTGTGLKVLYQTIQLLNIKNKSAKIRLEITNRSEEGQSGTLVSIYIPSHYNYEL